MVNKSFLRRVSVLGGLLLVALCVFAPMTWAQEEHGDEEAASDSSDIGEGLKVLGLGIGAGIAVAGAGLGTGRAQAGVGSAGAGALAEKPELFGNVLILFAIPETIVILGFVVAFLLLGAM